MKNLLLINPPIHDFTAYNLWAKPLGLLYISSILKNIGFNINFIDCLNPDYEEIMLKNDESYKKSKNRYFSTNRYFKKEIEKPAVYKPVKNRKYYRFGISPELLKELIIKIKKPDAIIITSMMTYWYPGVFETIDALKTIYPDVPVILGGIYAMLCPSHAKLKSKSDYIIDVNDTIVLINTLSLIFKDNSIIEKYNKLTLPVKPDIFNFFPDLDLYMTNEFIPILTSTGCLYKCKYCASGYLNKIFYERNFTDIFNEINHWKEKYNFKDLAFYDDALLLNKEKRIKPLLKKIISSNLKINMHTPNGLHINEVDKELALLMMESGFKTLRFGFETSNEFIQNDSGKKTTNKDFEKTMDNLFQAGFSNKEVGIYILLGIPNQTVNDVRRSIDFVKSFGVKPKLCEFSNIPYTNYFNKSSCKPEIDMINEPLYHNNSVLHLWNDNFDYETIEELKHYALE